MLAAGPPVHAVGRDVAEGGRGVDVGLPAAEEGRQLVAEAGVGGEVVGRAVHLKGGQRRTAGGTNDGREGFHRA